MKKLIFTIIGLFLLFGSVNSAWALVGYDEIYTVAVQGSDEEKAVFGWNEKPWLYLKLPDLYGDKQSDKTFSAWYFKEGHDLHVTSALLDSFVRADNQIWLSFSDERWQEFKETGDWMIGVASLIFKDDKYKNVALGVTNFTVTPEPVSSVLFLFGAGGILARRLKREKSA